MHLSAAGGEPAVARGSGLILQAPTDPGFAALRRAARAAIVIPVVFAFSEFVLHDAQNEECIAPRSADGRIPGGGRRPRAARGRPARGDRSAHGIPGGRLPGWRPPRLRRGGWPARRVATYG